MKRLNRALKIRDIIVDSKSASAAGMTKAV